MSKQRLTAENWRNFDPWECCGQDNYCQRGCHVDGGCNNGCMVPRNYVRLAKYEDIGTVELFADLVSKNNRPAVTDDYQCISCKHLDGESADSSVGLSAFVGCYHELTDGMTKDEYESFEKMGRENRCPHYEQNKPALTEPELHFCGWIGNPVQPEQAKPEPVDDVQAAIEFFQGFKDDVDSIRERPEIHKAKKAASDKYALAIAALTQYKQMPIYEDVESDVNVLNNMIIWNGLSDVANNAIRRAILALRQFDKGE